LRQTLSLVGAGPQRKHQWSLASILSQIHQLAHRLCLRGRCISPITLPTDALCS
jgi:hypothetical protein